MKQIFTLLFILFLSLVSFGQTFKNQPLISKRTADWCPNCGSWGWEFKLAIIDEIPADQATIVALHHSGGLANETNTALTDALGGFGQPTFFLNNTNLSASSGNWMSKLEQLKLDVETMNNEIPGFGIELHGYLGASANEVIAEIALHINQAADGEYYLGTYLLTNDLVHNQAGNSAGSNAEHKKILLDEFSGSPFGREIGNGPILEGVMDFTITNTFTEVPDAQTDIIVVVWKKEGDDYTVVNTAAIEGIELLSSNEEVNWITDAKTYFAQSSININLQSEEVIGEYKINILNTSGQIVKRLSDKTLDKSLEIQMDATALTTGTYFINLVSSKGIWSDKVIVLK